MQMNRASAHVLNYEERDCKWRHKLQELGELKYDNTILIIIAFTCLNVYYSKEINAYVKVKKNIPENRS